MKYYTGIGSRETPHTILKEMETIARKLGKYGYTLRSGGANGADSAFESTAPLRQIFLPWPEFNGNQSSYTSVSQEAIQIASQYHPVWHRLKSTVHPIMGRNVYQVLGQDLHTPSDFVVCWTRDGKDTGGTGLAIRIAWDNNIPVYNLYNKDDREQFYILLDSIREEYEKVL